MLRVRVPALYKNNLLIIKDDDGAITQQEIMKNLDSGVAMVSRQYARGVNLRFSTDALVMVLATKDIGLREVQQMAGRSSRRFGLCQAKVFCYCGDFWKD